MTTARRLDEDLHTRCKHTPWRPFEEAELRVTMSRWHWRKSTGSDGIAHEALVYLMEVPLGKSRILETLNDALYTGKITGYGKGTDRAAPEGTSPRELGGARAP